MPDPLDNVSTRTSFNLANWRTPEGRDAWLDYDSGGVQPGYAYLPMVFGDKARRFQIRASAYDPPGSQTYTVDVEIPGNHMPAPRVAAADVHVGPTTLHFEPRPWIGPSFTIDFDVTVVNHQPGHVYFVNFGSNSLFSLPNNLIEEGKPIVLSTPAYQSQPVRITVQDATATPFKGKVVPSNLPSPIAYRLMRDGVQFGLVEEHSFRHRVRFSVSDLVTYQVEDHWDRILPVTDRDMIKLFEKQAKNESMFQSGQTVQCVEFRMGEPARAEWIPKLPKWRKYPSVAATYNPGAWQRY